MELQFEPTRVYGLSAGECDLSHQTAPAVQPVDPGRLKLQLHVYHLVPGIYTIDHTFVDPSLRGQGMADKLVRAALEQIRKNGGTPAATCTYAVSWLEKHPEQA